jgi:DNA primase
MGSDYSNSKGSTLKLPVKKRREFLDKATKAYASSMDLVTPYLESRGITETTAAAWSLGYVHRGQALPGHEEYEDRLAIPYLTPAGTLTMKFRCVADHDCKSVKCVKYLGEPGELPRLFGVWNFRHDTPTLYLCEGELDAVVATQAGLRAIGIPGATQWRPYWALLFEGYDEVILLRDGDSAGREMAANLQGYLPNLRSVKMPEGEDVTSYVVKHGEEALRERVKV